MLLSHTFVFNVVPAPTMITYIFRQRKRKRERRLKKNKRRREENIGVRKHLRV